jgi:hypothetical protein
MRFLFFTGVLLAAVTGGSNVVFAQGQRAPVYPYCLLERGVGGPGAGGEMMSCLYNTWAQCMASKGGNTDTCIINPLLTFPPR